MLSEAKHLLLIFQTLRCAQGDVSTDTEANGGGMGEGGPYRRSSSAYNGWWILPADAAFIRMKPKCQIFQSKSPIGPIAGYYALLAEHLPGLEINPLTWGEKALEILSTMAKTGPLFREAASYLIARGHSALHYAGTEGGRRRLA